MVDDAQLGRRLRDRRERLGFSTDDVARHARISGDRVVDIEGGAGLGTFELGRICHALAVDPGSLLADDAVEADARRSVARFRRDEAPDALAPEDLRLLCVAAEVGRVGGHLRRLLGRPPSLIDRARDVKAITGSHAGREGYALGREARLRWAPDGAPLPSMYALLEGWGVHVARVQLSSPQIEAASLFEDGAVPVIVLNRAHPRCRLRLARRALLAHELCHLLHDGGSRELLTVVSRDVSDDPVEARANGFAPSFLAPQPWVRPQSSDVYDLVVEMASYWGLSYEGGVYHAKNLGLIEPDVAKVLLSRPVTIDASAFEQMPRRLAAAGDPSPAPLVDGLVSDLAVEAQAADLISRGRLAEILEMA